jgi:hypothetical protein
MSLDKETIYNNLYNKLTNLDVADIKDNLEEKDNSLEEIQDSFKNVEITGEDLENSVEDNIYKKLFDRIEKQKEKETSNILDENISAARKFKFGTAQEPTIAGSLFRLGQAGITSVFSDKTFDEAAREIERERQKEIFQKYPEFYGKKEDLTVLSGRMGMALADPVTFFIPWVKIAKAGRIGTIATGAGISAGETILREKTLYGDIDSNMVALSAVLGAAGTGISDVIARKIRNGKVKDKLVTVDKDGKPVVIETANTDSVVPLNISKNVEKALEEISDESFKISQPYIAKFTSNLESLGVKYSKRDKLNKQIDKIKKERKVIDVATKNSKQQKFDFVSDPTKLDLELKKLQSARTKNQQEINDILFSQQPEQLAITGFNSFRKAYERGLLKGSLGENLTRAFVHEMVRPIFGGIGGGAIGLYATDENSDAPLTAGLMAGIALGVFNKRLDNYKSKIVPKLPKKLKTAALEESEKIFKRSFRTWAKTTLAGTHAAKLTAEANPVLNKFGEDLIGNRGNAFDFGKTLTNSIEEYKDTVSDYFRKQLYDITGELDDETLEAAGRIVQQSGIKNKMKYNFAKQSDLNNAKAVEAADKLLKLNKSIATYAKKAGLEFTELESYGLTQILDNIQVNKISFEKAQKIIAKAFQIQNSNNIKKGIETKKLKDKDAFKRATSYLNNSDDIRRVEVIKAEGEDVEKIVLKLLNSTAEDVLNKNKTLMQSARFIQNKRILVDPEARAFAKELFIQQPEFTTLRLIENTVPVAEFARRFGAQGQGISEVIKDIRKFYSGFGDIKVNRSLQKLVKEDIKAVQDTVNAYFGVFHAGSKLNQNDIYRSIALTLQTILSTTKLTKVVIPSLGDLVQTINNSGFAAAANSALRQLRSTSKNPSAMLAQRSANIKEGILGRKWSDRSYNGTLERELNDFSLQASTNYQKFLVKSQQRFFEIVQLGRMTRFAREFAYDAGAFRAFDLGRIAGKGKFPRKNIRELNSLGMSVDNAKYLSKFKSMDEAYTDPIGKQIIDIAGRKAANRDALIPQIGNRRLFSQSKNPFIKFLGSFLSWAQAKSTQTNSLVRRIEDGDGKLAVMMLASIPLYATVRQLQIALNPTPSVQENFPNPLENEQEFKEFLAETIIFSGQVVPWYADKVVNFSKFNKNNALETLYPVAGLLNDSAAIFVDAPSAIGKVTGLTDEGKPLSTLVKLAETVVPFGKDITRRKIVGEVFGLRESIKDVAEGVDKEQEFRPRYTTGGLIEGEYEVPNTKENPADRINPYTGEPYEGLLLEDLPFFNLDIRQTFNDGGLPEEDGLSEEERERLTLQAQELMKLDPPLQQTAPVIELLVAGVPRIIYGIGKTGFTLINTLAKESVKKPKPVNYYHGSNLKLKEVTPMGDRATAPDVKDLFQQASYIAKPGDRGLELANFYARGGGFVNVIGKKQFDEVVKKLYNPRNISNELKDKVTKEISMRQAFITKAKTEKVNRNKLRRARREIVDLENLVKLYGSGYISRITPVQRKFLEREGFDGVDVSDDVVAIFRKVPVKSSIRGSLTQRLINRRNARQSKINE